MIPSRAIASWFPAGQWTPPPEGPPYRDQHGRENGGALTLDRSHQGRHEPLSGALRSNVPKGTKLHAICDSRGRPLNLFVTITFLILVLFGIPLAFSLWVSALTVLWMAGIGALVFPPRLMNAVNSVLLISIPLFMMAGELMLMGGESL
ncbi:hypothetical protein GGQ68_000318 [Sagittula marina]|uniref:Uncharacterized protein n=1 Tax=Sagittula marina TaxID=943940 RepID=A0A7W6DJQ0_9RHOB|nr:hypothetical protein [Sagittula marina]